MMALLEVISVCVLKLFHDLRQGMAGTHGKTKVYVIGHEGIMMEQVWHVFLDFR